MIKICNKCNRIMAYEPYFKKYICRQCGYEVDVKKAIVVKIKANIITVKKPKESKATKPVNNAGVEHRV